MRRAMIVTVAAGAALAAAVPVANASQVHATKAWTIGGPVGSKAWGSASRSGSNVKVVVNLKARKGAGWKTTLYLKAQHGSGQFYAYNGKTERDMRGSLHGTKVSGRICVSHRGLHTTCGSWKRIY
ncbi:hypothetical protein J4573_11525 [Actinomadura barringtoniae]|uniref:DUF2147 domain-containing protein n=1 Tax=Actinomadura barringtoniae TaxID=1427535 RepID=A0A939PFT9_9ACTN|nr:hypothetical protein [Actinomadura barringtoniae]MBO2447721.1 hypothetical protein [Actinomadura barringtoniae]